MRKYSDAVMHHFFAAEHVGRLPEIRGMVRVVLGVDERVELSCQIDEHGVIQCAKFKAYGNPFTIAASAFACEALTGQTVQAIKDWDFQAFQEALDMPEDGVPSAILIEEVLKEVLKRYEQNV